MMRGKVMYELYGVMTELEAQERKVQTLMAELCNAKDRADLNKVANSLRVHQLTVDSLISKLGEVHS